MLIHEWSNLNIEATHDHLDKLDSGKHKFRLNINVHVNWKLRRIHIQFLVTWESKDDRNNRKVDFDIDTVYTVHKILTCMGYEINYTEFTDQLESYLLYELDRISKN